MKNPSKIMLICPARGKPAPEVNWIKDGVMVEGGKTIRTPDSTMCTIEIKNLNCTHICNYVCEAQDEYGINTSKEKSINAAGSHAAKQKFSTKSNFNM